MTELLDEMQERQKTRKQTETEPRNFKGSGQAGRRTRREQTMVGANEAGEQVRGLQIVAWR
jgi:hypothetical protein